MNMVIESKTKGLNSRGVYGIRVNGVWYSATKPVWEKIEWKKSYNLDIIKKEDNEWIVFSDGTTGTDNKNFEETKQKRIEEMHNEKTENIQRSVALNNATELMKQMIISNIEVPATIEDITLKIIEVSEIFLTWLEKK